jgi:DNA-binding GntR family transcriptional regulator
MAAMPRVTSDIAYDYIRERIVSREFPMGYALKTAALSAAMGISRTPIREALLRLETDGLVEIVPHYGASVMSLDVNEFSELCLLRLALESFLAGIAAELRTETDLHEIGLAIEAMRRLTREIGEGGNERESVLFPKLIHEDVCFHIAIMTAARKPRIKKEILRIHLINRIVAWDVINQQGFKVSTPAMRLQDREDAMIGHEEIYKAIVAGQAASARDAMQRHIQHIIDVNVSRMKNLEVNPLPRRTLTKEEEIYSG